MPRIRRHLSFANVVSIMALVFAMGGTGYAALKLPKNSVGGAQIKKDAVTGAKVKNSSLGPSDIRNGSLLRDDFAAGQLPAGERGPAGPVGAAGPAGPSGAAGPIGSYGDITIQRTDGTVADNTFTGLEATCPAGTKLISGGASLTETSSDDIRLIISRPGSGSFIPGDGESTQTWRAVYRNPAGGTATGNIRAFALCAEAP